MSNLLTFPKMQGKHNGSHVEATPDGVNIMTLNDAGMHEHVALIAYENAVNRLDAGEYDDIPDMGYAIHHAVADGGARGWFYFTAQHNVTMWRWLIAAVFIAEMELKNGTTTVTGSDGTSSQVAIYSSGDSGIVVLLRLTWYGTALGLANEAAAHNDGFMPLDEVGQGADAGAVYQSAYALFNGLGKLQGAKEGGNRDLKRWRTVAVSTGEMDMETFVATSGKKIKAGQLVRLLNIPLSKAVRFHEYQNGKQHADAIKDAYQNNHGAAGRAWISWLADHQTEAVNTIRESEARWRSLIPADYGEQVHRVAGRFAILEAALILSEQITGWDALTCRDAIQHSYNAWVREFGTGNKEHQQIIEQTEAFLNAYGFSRYMPYPEPCPRDLPIKDLAGYRTGSIQNEGDKFIFYTFPATFEKEIAQNFNPKLFAKVLAQSGMLESSQDRYKRKALKRIGGKQHTFYILTYQPEDEDSEGK